MEKKTKEARLAFTKRPLSWSAISSFEFDRESWYQKYVLGYKTTSKEMEFGKAIGKKLETDSTYLPMVPRYGTMEYEFKVKLGGIKLIGYADTFDHQDGRRLGEFKTGKKEWDQNRVNEHGQLTMYVLMNQIQNKVKPEDVEITLTWMPTEIDEDFNIRFADDIESKIQTFKTRRTQDDINQFVVRLAKVYNEMKKYALSHE